MFVEHRQVRSQMREDKFFVKRAGHRIETPVTGKLVPAAIPVGSRKALLEAFGRADDRAVTISYGDRAETNENPVSRLVAKRDMGDRWLSVVQHRGQRGGGVRQHVLVPQPVPEQVLPAETPDNLLAKVTGNLLRALVPEQNPLDCTHQIT